MDGRDSGRMDTRPSPLSPGTFFSNRPHPRAYGAARPRSEVTGHESLIGHLELPDPDDRHVLAAAIHAEAAPIVTLNLKDFPEHALKHHNISALHPDDFLLSLFFASPSQAHLGRARQGARQASRHGADPWRHAERRREGRGLLGDQNGGGIRQQFLNTFSRYSSIHGARPSCIWDHSVWQLGANVPAIGSQQARLPLQSRHILADKAKAFRCSITGAGRKRRRPNPNTAMRNKAAVIALSCFTCSKATCRFITTIHEGLLKHFPCKNSGLTQIHMSLNQRVQGSNPCAPTN